MHPGFGEGSYEAVRDCGEFLFISLEAERTDRNACVMSYRSNQCEAGIDPRFVHHGRGGGLRCKLFRRDK